MFNVGHGEAVLVIFDNGKAWLMECGTNSIPRNKSLGEGIVDYLQERNLVLDTIVASHPHFDHAGALETILASASSHIANPLTIFRTDIKEWDSETGWRKRYRDAVDARDAGVEEIALLNGHREVSISASASAHIFVGTRNGFYTSLFVHLRYRNARILFTGDAHCGYETKLLNSYGAEDFRADVLKVTHHGNSSGTALKVVNAIRPGIAIAGTGDGSGHRLEKDTLARLGGRPGPRRIFETVIDGDIILRTDGLPYRKGILYQAEFEPPGRFANDLDAEIKSLEAVNSQRTEGNYPACDAA